ncbi:hypothetical protein RND81_08G009900 [Saponaria officinalis]|uniref:Uncharacterized protein n=1 Tax=Saponaria officinalis TaxID=3572 RepID=A0AAW1J1H0_SAPOF
MDESWRMTMGTTDSRRTHRRRQSVGSRASNSETEFQPEDFDDVFGGPPRSVLARKLSADFTASEWFYQEVFGESVAGKLAVKEGKRLPEFRIPEQRRSKEKSSSMSKSKSTSSSVLSFEEVSPFRSPGMVAVGEEDAALSSFTSRLRPLNVPNRWSSTSTTSTTIPKCKNNKHELPTFGCNDTTYTINNTSFTTNNYMINNFIFGFPHPPPIPNHENINLNANNNNNNNNNNNFDNIQLTVDNYHLRPRSPSSTLSSFRHDNESENKINFSFDDNMSYQPQAIREDEDDDEDGDEIMSSSYIIEMNSHTSEANNSEAIDIDEAIAWAKEQFRG